MRRAIIVLLLIPCLAGVVGLSGGCGSTFDECLRAGISPDEIELMRSLLVLDQMNGLSFEQAIAEVVDSCSLSPFAGVDSGDCLVCIAAVVFDVYGMSTDAAICPFTNDGECDDGRLGAHTNLCDLGTDVADCANVDPTVCQTTNDGECDDGRPGAPFAICAPGTDAADCGPLPVT